MKNILFAIRDDDTSYFTRPEELECAYNSIKAGPISISVVPNTVPVHKDNVFPYGKGIPFNYYSISNNTELIKYLRDNCSSGRYEVLLHGYTHEYKNINGKWIAEMLWKGEKQILDELTTGKQMLESILSTEISTFVAPNNSIDKKAISAIEQLGMNYSGIIMKNDRLISKEYIENFVRRWTVRAIQGIQYPGILNYGKHKELAAYSIDNMARLKKEYKACKQKGVPFTIYTHYWKVNSNPKVKAMLNEIYEYCINDGAQLVQLSKCF